MLSRRNQREILKILAPLSPERVGVFGSYARNEETPDSDLDILICLKDGVGMLQLVRIERELSESIGVKVDLVTDRALKDSKLRSYIEGDLKLISP
ncbi:MAG: nucleotidyltransferase domain-containing protein [Cyclobacteriaceae bacterium]